MLSTQFNHKENKGNTMNTTAQLTREKFVARVDVTPDTVSQLLRRLGPRQSVHIAAYIDDRIKGTDTIAEVRKVLFDNPHLFYCRGDAWGVRQP